MKNIIIYSLFLLTFFSACDSGFEDINTDPTSSSDLDPNIRLSEAQLTISGQRGVQERTSFAYTSSIVQHFGGAWVAQYGGRYIKDNDFMTGLWASAYVNEVKNIVDVVETTKDDASKVNIHNVSRIMKVYIFSRLTDLHGDIPYFEAAKGFSDRSFKPKYDTQKEIYDDFFKELDEAVQGLDAGGDPVTGDIFYNGDIAKWVKFGNSLRLRLAMRLSEVNPIKAQEQVAAALAGGVMVSNDDICLVRHEATVTDVEDIRGNGISHVFNGGPHNVGFRYTSTFVDQLKNTKDPRLGVVAAVYDEKAHKDFTDLVGFNGIDPGNFTYDDWNPVTISDPVTGDVLFSSQSNRFPQPHDKISRMDAPYIHMSFAEVDLLKAEAAFRGWTTGSAATYYEAGIRSSLSHMDLYTEDKAISDAAVDQFVIDNPLQAGEELRIINSQLWVTHLFNGVEAYNNWRRSGFPLLTPVNHPDGQSGGVIPRRIPYPSIESFQNEDSYTEAVQRLGGSDDWVLPVWWDVN